jgi:hypothetical protein
MMRVLNNILAIVLSVVIVLCGTSVNPNVSAESENDQKRIVVSLGDSYSSGEGIPEFYGQDKAMQYRLLAINDLDYFEEYLNTDDGKDWLAHRSTKSWAGQLVLDSDLVMSEHRNENWYFEAVSGAEIKNLGVDKSYLDTALDVINNKMSKQLESENITQTEVTQEKIYQDRFSSQDWEIEKQRKEVSTSYTISYISNKIPDLIWKNTYIEMPYQLDVFDSINKGDVDYVTMTLSGNDIGFTDIVYKAATGSRLNVNVLTDKLNQSLTLFDNKVKYYLYSTYAAIQDKAGDQAKIIIAGYPQLFADNTSPFIPNQSSTEINKCVTIFNKRIKQIVDDCRIYGGMNIYFVSVEEIFEGHGAYAVSVEKVPYGYGQHSPDSVVYYDQENSLVYYDDAYINSIQLLNSNDLDQTKVIGSAYSIHPNEEGAKAYASEVQNKINELEQNGLISGNIYEDSNKTWNKDAISKIRKITAINTKTSERKSIYTNILDSVDKLDYDEDLNGLTYDKYDEDCIYSDGYYEMVVPVGDYNLEVTLNDGTIITYDKSINVDAGAISRNNDIYLDGFSTPELSESDLKNLVAAYGTISVWEYHDYDSNGVNEAYAITTTIYSHSDLEMDAVYYVSADGNVQLMSNSIAGFLYDSSDGHYRQTQGKGFLWADYGGGASSWNTILYGVKDDGTPYELDLSRDLQGFYEDENGFYTTENEFMDGGGHLWPEVSLIYDSATQQFTKGARRDENDDLDILSEGIEYVGNWYEGEGYVASRYLETLIRNDDNHITIKCEPPVGFPTVTNLEISSIDGSTYSLNNGTFRSESGPLENNVTGQLVVNDDSTLDVTINYSNGSVTKHFILNQ